MAGELGEATAPLARGDDPRARLVAQSRAMEDLLAVLDRLRGSDLPVLIQEETGTGKEVVARVIHAESRRSAGPFQVVDPSAIPLPLLKVELFGTRAGRPRPPRRPPLARERSGTLAEG